MDSRWVVGVGSVVSMFAGGCSSGGHDSVSEGSGKLLCDGTGECTAPEPRSGLGFFTDCRPGFTYCGEHFRVRAALEDAGQPTGNLYRCNDDQTVTPAEVCANGCEILSSGDDECKAPNPPNLDIVAEVPGVPLYGQFDPRWAGNPYLGQDDCTVGVCGCTMTALTISASWAAKDPAITPACINENYGFALQIVRDVRHLGDDLNIPLTYIDESNGYHLFDVDPDSQSYEERLLLESVRQSIRSGYPVILGMKIDYFGGGWSRHSTVATAVRADGDILLHDPGSGGVSWFSMYRAGKTKGPFRGYDFAEQVRRPVSLPANNPCQ